MNEPRVCFLGDTHGNLIFVKAAIDAAKRMGAQVIIQVGDFGIWDHVPAGIAFLDGVNRALETEDMWLIFCDGNHENFDSLLGIPVESDGFRHVRERIWHAPRGHIWSMEGVAFMAMGGAHSIDSWPTFGGIWNPNFDPSRTPHRGWWPQEMITPNDVQTALDNYTQWGLPIDVLISHDCPAGVDIPRIKGYPKGNENRTLLKHVVQEVSPQLLVCGHYHRRVSTTFNESTRVEILDAENTDALLLLGLDPFRLILNSAS